MTDASATAIIGTWRHSHEEDTETETVFRPESFDFPPARGRVGYTFRKGGSCDYLGISPRDGTAKEECRWELTAGSKREIVITRSGGRREVLPVVTLGGEKLVVRKSG